MKQPKDWDEFLKHTVDNYELQGKSQCAFLTRFAYENWRKQDKEIWELAGFAAPEAYKKQMTNVYACFSQDQPNGCPELASSERGPGKYQILRDWLHYTKHPEWLQSMATLVLPDTNVFDYETPVPLNSPFYVERPQIESNCYEAILPPGALIRIKAPRQMGKTSLLDRILAHAARQGYRKVRVNLLQVEQTKLGTLDKFLRWFCTYISDRLQPSSELNDYWTEDRGSMVSCTRYLEMLLKQQESPLILGLDGVDRIFQYPEISRDFFYLLRSWHEEANNLEVWEQLRLVVVHCTEDYGRLDINQSPFNVGVSIKLEEFSQAQVEELARHYQLEWCDTQVQQLMAMVGGHPYLVQSALYHIAREGLALEPLLQDAPTEAGIYYGHLRPLLVTLTHNFPLAAAFKQTITTTEPVQLDSMVAYKLYSMGLIQWHGNQVIPRCGLYRQYFQERLEIED